MKLFYTKNRISLKQEPWDFSTILRLLGIVWLIGLYLQTTRWTSHLNLITLVLLLGFGLGLTLGKSKFRVGECILLGTSFTLPSLFLILPFAVEVNGSFLSRQLVFMTRLQIAIGQFISGKPVETPILFLTIAGVISWSLGMFVGFTFNRSGKPWLGVTISVLTFLLIDFFLPVPQQNGLISAAFIFVIVLLATRLFYNGKRSEWKRKKITYDEETGFDLSHQVILNSLMIVVVAWSLPSVIKVFIPGTLENDRLQSIFERFSGAKNIVSSLESVAEGGSVVYRTTFALGSEVPTGEQQIFAVESSSYPPSGSHFYWKSRTYDLYESGQWSNEQSLTNTYDAFDKLDPIPSQSSLFQYQFIFRVTQQMGTYYFAGIPDFVNSPGKLVFASGDAGQKDVISILPNSVLSSGEVFQVSSWINRPAREELRNSSEDYPGWITDRYLQIPVDFPQRVIDLAISITKEYDNPYDKAVAITNYLRGNFAYVTSVEGIPEGVDAVEWFLFESQQGFCTYFATAEVMMLRAIGIPARLAIGYAEGETSASGKLFRVRAKDSHSWPEVYFVGYGWIEFEPTPIITELVAPSVESPAAAQPTLASDLEFEQLAFEDPRSMDLPSQSTILVEHKPTNTSAIIITVIASSGVVALIICGIVYYRKVTRREKIHNFPRFMIYIYKSRNKRAPAWLMEWAWRIEQPVIERLFSVVPEAARLLRVRLKPSQTPAEKVEAIQGQLPEAREDASILLEEYQKTIYGDRSANIRTASGAAKRIRSFARRKAVVGAFKRK